MLRDPIACKPAVMAETGSYVAFGTEYRALASLPGIERPASGSRSPQRLFLGARPVRHVDLAPTTCRLREP